MSSAVSRTGSCIRSVNALRDRGSYRGWERADDGVTRRYQLPIPRKPPTQTILRKMKRQTAGKTDGNVTTGSMEQRFLNCHPVQCNFATIQFHRWW